ncbi:MAG: hypothetical protein F2741_06680, partial [Actinobacteria bacterium]|nr:hypothetical protein [Actinomycetota bacterium]
MASAKTDLVLFAIDEVPKRNGVSTNRNDPNANNTDTMHVTPNAINPASGKSMTKNTNNGQC